MAQGVASYPVAGINRMHGTLFTAWGFRRRGRLRPPRLEMESRWSEYDSLIGVRL